MASLPAQIRGLAEPPSSSALTTQITTHIDSHFPDLDALVHPGTQQQHASGPSKRKRRNLEEEIKYWEEREARAQSELAETSRELPPLLDQTHSGLQTLLHSAQELSIQRYDLADKVVNLVSDIGGGTKKDEGREAVNKKTDSNPVLLQVELLQEELGKLEAGLAWAKILEEVVGLSEATLNPANHKPSPLAALPQYRQLNDLVGRLAKTLPTGMGLVDIVRDICERTWNGLKDVMSQNLLRASELIGWPRKVVYENVPADARRTFERAYQDLLYLQAEGEDLHDESHLRPPHWSSGKGLYPLQAMVKPIELRFKYHFQGVKGTNRVDKPEWAFANILDQIFEHHTFLTTYIQPLTSHSGYSDIDIRSEFTLLLFPILLSLIRSRIPHILDHPALLAHTVYQTVMFDEAVRQGGFDLDGVSMYEARESPKWEGLVGVILRKEDWFSRWVAGEKKFADKQLNDIISSSDAWTISDELPEGEEEQAGLRPTISGRQVKALIEQISDRYAPLPELEYKLPFLISIQLPILSAYHARISGSLDAFESLSSAFVRVVPGALAGNTRSGIHIDQAKLTGGSAGVERLIKAWLSSKWIAEASRKWADSLFFVEMSNDLQHATSLKWKVQADPLIPQGLKVSTLGVSAQNDTDVSVFDVIIGHFDLLCSRAEDMIMRLVTVEVENDLKQHLTRRWDNPPSTEPTIPSAYLLSALTTYTAHLTTITATLPPLVTSRLYRKIVADLSRHIMQRGVYSGWSKFSEMGGRDFQCEVDEWKDVSAGVFNRKAKELSAWEVQVDAPWKTLSDVSKLLSLPTSFEGVNVKDGDNVGEAPTFAQGMAAAWAAGKGLVAFEERLGVDLGKEEIQAVLRRRMECWR
ncbi:hypothetical protein IAT38_003682 [Cryptococcus sp. DSM 104549]